MKKSKISARFYNSWDASIVEHFLDVYQTSGMCGLLDLAEEFSLTREICFMIALRCLHWAYADGSPSNWRHLVNYGERSWCCSYAVHTLGRAIYDRSAFADIKSLSV